jgi:hypothetical protein
MAKKIGWTDQAKGDVRAMDRQAALDLLHGLARFLSTEEGDVSGSGTSTPLNALAR